MKGRPLDPGPISGGIGVDTLVDDFFLSYNAGRLREACHIFADKMLAPDVTVGLSGATSQEAVTWGEMLARLTSDFSKRQKE